jgi:hypothetical protein
LLWARQIGRVAGGACFGEVDESCGDFSGRDRLGEHPRHKVDRAELHLPEDLLGELVELGGAEDRPRNGPGRHELLLQGLARVVAEGGAVAADDREGEVVADAGGPGRRQEVRGDAAEEGRETVADCVPTDAASTTTSTPASAGARPAPVVRSTPVERASTTTS